MNYRSYINSKRWERKKNSVRNFSFTNKRCYICGKKRADAHHKTYKRLGHEAPNDIVFLCRYHHFGAHDYCKENNRDLYNGTLEYIKNNKKIPKKLRWTKHMIHVYRVTNRIPKKLDFL